MRKETLLTAAARIVRLVRCDDQHEGGLLSRSTIQANEILAMQVGIEEHRQKAAEIIVAQAASPTDR